MPARAAASEAGSSTSTRTTRSRRAQLAQQRGRGIGPDVADRHLVVGPRDEIGDRRRSHLARPAEDQDPAHCGLTSGRCADRDRIERTDGARRGAQLGRSTLLAGSSMLVTWMLRSPLGQPGRLQRDDRAGVGDPRSIVAPAGMPEKPLASVVPSIRYWVLPHAVLLLGALVRQHSAAHDRTGERGDQERRVVGGEQAGHDPAGHGLELAAAWPTHESLPMTTMWVAPLIVTSLAPARACSRPCP